MSETTQPDVVSYRSAAQELIEAQGLLARHSILNLPTGSGKTWLAARAIGKAIASGRRAAYICPLRALAKELSAKWAADMPGQVAAFTGESGSDDGWNPANPREVPCGIFTAEKMDSYLRAWQSNLDWLALIDVLIIDELHLLGDGRRGATLEGLIERFRTINPYAHVISLSATLGNVPELSSWLEAEAFVGTERMVPLAWRIVSYVANAKSQASKADIVLDEARATREEGGQAIIFTQSRPRAESLAQHLTNNGMRAAAHHAGLPRTRRNEAEAAFRHGALDVIVATPTLALGVNLPARKVVLVDLQRFEWGNWTDLSCNEVWQLAGRAGRLGLDECGEVVLLAPRHNQTAARRYIVGKFEPIRSQWGNRAHMHEQLLALVASGMARNASQLQRLVSHALFAIQTPDAPARVKAGIAEMLKAGMLEEDAGGTLKATRLGRVAVRHQITPRTVMTWSRFARLDDKATFLDALILVSASPEREGGLRADAGELISIADALNTEPVAARSIPLHEWPHLFGQDSGRDLVAGIKAALALRAWTRLGDLEEAAAACGVDAHALDEVRMSAVRLLGALRAVLAALREPATDIPDPGADPDLLERLSALTAMVSTGLDEQHATLGLIDGIGPKLARRLIAAGIEDIEDLAGAEAGDVASVDGISLKRAGQWIEEAGELLGQGGAYRYREIARGGNAVEISASDLDIYRWRRAAVLQLEPSDAGWQVTGGAEPHQVAHGGDACDCQDALKGHLCKHRIAVLHHLGDPRVPAFDAPFATGEAANLTELWNAPLRLAEGWR